MPLKEASVLRRLSTSFCHHLYKAAQSSEAALVEVASSCAKAVSTGSKGQGRHVEQSGCLTPLTSSLVKQVRCDKAKEIYIKFSYQSPRRESTFQDRKGHGIQFPTALKRSETSRIADFR